MGHFVPQFQSGKISGRDGRRIYIMEQMRIFNRPQNSGVVLTGLGTLLVLIISFQLSVQPTQAASSGSYRQLLSLQPHELLNLYYNRAPSYKPVQSNFIWQKRGPGSEFLGKRGGGYRGNSRSKRVPGSEFLGKRVPGSEFLGKRNMEDDENLNELINMVKRSPESALDAGIQSDRNAFEAALENN